MRNFLLNIFLIILSANSLHSLDKSKISGFDLYEPGTFNPLGPTLLYGDQDKNKRPYMLIAYNEKEQILEKSLLQYSKEGKLIAEKIFNSRNEFTGEIHYLYDANGKVIQEIYYDNQKNQISLKKREYKNDRLVGIQFYDKDRLIFTRKYTYENNRIIGREFAKEFSEPFVIYIKNGLIESLEFKEKSKTLMQIKSIYEGSKLIQRNKESLDSRSKCIYEYDPSARLTKYMYYDWIRNQWKKSKSIQVVYADQI
ncbi:MAG: hypothetical protein ACK4UJ_05465 [Leptonema sp. (in: bacteria)]